MSLENILGLDKMLVMKFKQVFIFIEDELQTSIESNIYCKRIKEKSFWFNEDGLKNDSL